MSNKFTVKLDDLKRAVKYNRSIMSNKGVDENNKNVIFLANSEGLRVASHVTGTDGIIEIDLVQNDVEDDWSFQLRSSSLSKLIQANSNLPSTKVENITFIEGKGAVSIIAHEEVKSEDDDTDLAQDAHYRIGVVPIEARVKKAVDREFPSEGVTTVSAAAVDLYFRDLLRLVNNAKSAGSESLVNVSKDYAFVHSALTYSAFLHDLPEEFHDITLNYAQALSLLVLNDESTGNPVDEAVTDDEEIQEYSAGLFEDGDEDGFEDGEGVPDPRIEVARVSGNSLAFRFKTGTLYLTVRGVRVRFADHFDPAFETDEEGNYVNRDLLFSVDRVSMKNALKRASFDNSDVAFTVNDGFLNLEGKSFKQDVVLEDFEGDVDSLGFTVSPTVIEDMIIGNDKEMTQVEEGENVVFIFSPTKLGYTLRITDDTSLWISTVNIKGKR